MLSDRRSVGLAKSLLMYNQYDSSILSVFDLRRAIKPPTRDTRRLEARPGQSFQISHLHMARGVERWGRVLDADLSTVDDSKRKLSGSTLQSRNLMLIKRL